MFYNFHIKGFVGTSKGFHDLQSSYRSLNRETIKAYINTLGGKRASFSTPKG